MPSGDKYLCGNNLWTFLKNMWHAALRYLHPTYKHARTRYNDQNCRQLFFSPLLSDDRRLSASGLTFQRPNFHSCPLYMILNPDAAWLARSWRLLNMHAAHYSLFFSLISKEEYFFDTFTSTRPSALLLNPLCKWKVPQIVPLYVNFHFLSLPIPCLTLPLMLFNTQSFPRGRPHAVSAVVGQKQREACREIQGLSVYGRMTLILFQLHEGAKGKKPQRTRSLGLARDA